MVLSLASRHERGFGEGTTDAEDDVGLGENFGTRGHARPPDPATADASREGRFAAELDVTGSRAVRRDASVAARLCVVHALPCIDYRRLAATSIAAASFT